MNQKLDAAPQLGLEAANAGRGQAEQELLHSSGKVGLLVHGIKLYARSRRPRDQSRTAEPSVLRATPPKKLSASTSRFFLKADRQAAVPMRAVRHAASEGKFEGEGWRAREDESRFGQARSSIPSMTKAGRLSDKPK
jgi:hypothetical protein